jgi:hypothetical protein
MRANLLLLLLGAVVVSASLAACNGIKVPDEIPVPVGVSCVDQDKRPRLPAAAARPEAEIKALDDYKAVLRLRTDRLELAEYAIRAEAIVEGCSRITPAPGAPGTTAAPEAAVR